MREEAKVDSRYFTVDEYKGHEALTIHFEVIQGDLLRSTKEYSLTYVPETDEWLGDVIACGQWWDLEPDDMEHLRANYGLDALMQMIPLRSTI